MNLQFRTLWLSIGWAWLVIIMVLSLISIPKTVEVNIPHIDKVEHTISYFILMFLFAQCYWQRKSRIKYAIGFIALGVLLEIFQSFTIDRHFEYADMIANSAGVILGLVLSDSFLKNIVIYLDKKLSRFF